MRWIGLLLVLVLAGCGVRPTDPVSAGEPPVGAAPGPILVFLQAGKLQPVVRETGRLGTPAEAVALLLAGPTPQEDAAGLSSGLPPGAVGASVGALDQGIVTVNLTAPLGFLPELAKDQIVCTVIAVQAQTGADAANVLVRLVGAPGITQADEYTTTKARPDGTDSERGRSCPLVR
ncbi:hypothetical protein GCM10017786_72850 [Amycolatopsis deserti]|uniref:GerMN domain-containing protein n=1 Tax=Amycolatopsis deserti TaxID=185696 RepID=A0ABQ3JGH2_9PSEU|nr:GerMN domain-containing protein [Amycolatopsis deserti]GHF28197.1 hypothetical protein GCM10017786_72850 [Amycolatopsis deserti]